MVMKPVLEYHRLRAPAENGGILFDPAPVLSGKILDENTSRIENADYYLQEKSFANLLQSARRELVEKVRRYTASYRDVPLDLKSNCRILLTGHQPELFHPGVWFKNFALSALAHRHNAIGINLVIDNDPVRRCSIPVPAGSIQRPHTVAVALDRNRDAIPYEERRCTDRTLFASFGERVSATLAPFVSEPIIRTWWPDVTHALDRTHRIGQSIAQARHQLESDYGLATLEVPLSSVCDTNVFRLFTIHLLAHLHRFRREYNESLAEYRHVHRLRSPAQPVRDLSQQGEWIEAPFWVWSEEDPRRRRLFVRFLQRHILMTDRHQWQLKLPISSDSDATPSVEQLTELRTAGWKVRPRAIITTLFARLLLGDLFLHGIGGAKYDQITDMIIAKFFGMTPPKYLTLTATLQLPIHLPLAVDDDVRRIDQQMRELRFHPEKHIDVKKIKKKSELEEITRWITSKHEWVARQFPVGHRRLRHQAIQRANQHLQQFLESQRKDITRRRENAIAARQRTRILASREYAFCLYPRDYLENHLRAFTVE